MNGDRGREPRPPGRHAFHADDFQSTGSIPKRQDMGALQNIYERPTECIEKPVEKIEAGYKPWSYLLSKPVPPPRLQAGRPREKPVGIHDKDEQNKDILQKNFDKLQKDFDKLQKNFDKLQKNFDNLQEQFDDICKRIGKNGQGKAGTKSYAVWMKEEPKAVNVILDAATAHPALLLSEHGKRVTWQEPCQDLPSSSQRFDSLPCVLGQQGISSGKCHWEVEVGDTQSWDLGICRDNVKRKGRVTMSPGNGFWAIRLYDGEYWALTSPETALPLKERPLRVGIFLDYEAGEVSFCNMTDGSYIFSFPKKTFNGVLRPLFRLWSSGSGPLSIVHVEEK
ncbi:butyrophilin subfamily 1 member A1-like isoform X3 [Myotis yumanensis]|uniref:butyrophilin subfamily 1 member A1-like isoform X3 n=1 Tax=Myotis yumanensis TaxID=159337 RepID=UPI0038D05CFD